MSGWAAWCRWLVVAVLPLFLWSCAEVQFAAQTAKDLQSPGRGGGASGYKVGKPYQIGGVWYYPAVDYAYDESGIASWYGPGFDGKRTANGEIFDENDLTAAHRTLPLPSLVEVINLENGRSIQLRVNDRGPFRRGRIIDVSRRGAQLLGFEGKGTAKVRVRVLEVESRQLAAAALGNDASAEVGAAPTPPAVPVESVTVEALPATGAAAPPRASPPMPTDGGAQLAARGVAEPTPVPDGRVSFQPVAATAIFVQAGAFTRYDNARQLAARLTPLGAVRIAPTVIDGTQFYRVQLGPVDSVELADGMLARLLDNGFDGSRVVVQ